jgi:osmotically-inducible protein OsmY
MKIKLRSALRPVLSAFAVAVLAACSSLPVPPAGSDAALAAEIRARLSSDTLTDRQNIGVSVSEGIVTLSGNVSNQGVKSRAKDIVRGVDGIKGVVDNLVGR